MKKEKKKTENKKSNDTNEILTSPLLSKTKAEELLSKLGNLPRQPLKITRK